MLNTNIRRFANKVAFLEMPEVAVACCNPWRQWTAECVRKRLHGNWLIVCIWLTTNMILADDLMQVLDVVSSVWEKPLMLSCLCSGYTTIRCFLKPIANLFIFHLYSVDTNFIRGLIWCGIHFVKNKRIRYKCSRRKRIVIV